HLGPAQGRGRTRKAVDSFPARIVIMSGFCYSPRPGRGAIRASSRHDVGRGGAFMRNACWPISRPARRFLRPHVAAALAAMVLSAPLPARAASLDDVIGAIVTLKTHINPEGRTIQGLGGEREGSGVLIDADGLILTIGYLMVEADAAEITTNDGHT